MPVRRGAAPSGSWRVGGGREGRGRGPALGFDIVGGIGAQHRHRIDLARIGERTRERAVVLAPHDDRDGDVRGIESAGARGHQYVAGLERVVRDVERADVEIAVAAPAGERGQAVARAPYGNDLVEIGRAHVELQSIKRSPYAVF